MSSQTCNEFLTIFFNVKIDRLDRKLAESIKDMASREQNGKGIWREALWRLSFGSADLRRRQLGPFRVSPAAVDPKNQDVTSHRNATRPRDYQSTRRFALIGATTKRSFATNGRLNAECTSFHRAIQLTRFPSIYPALVWLSLFSFLRFLNEPFHEIKIIYFVEVFFEKLTPKGLKVEFLSKICCCNFSLMLLISRSQVLILPFLFFQKCYQTYRIPFLTDLKNSISVFLVKKWAKFISWKFFP